MLVVCYHQVITDKYQLLLLTFHFLEALIMCQALCQSLYISILICSREQPQAVGSTSNPILQCEVSIELAGLLWMARLRDLRKYQHVGGDISSSRPPCADQCNQW